MHGTLDNLSWTTERVDQLKDLIDARMTASQIADRLKVSRGSVVGKAFRQGWEFNSDTPRNYKVRKELKEKGLYVPPVRSSSRKIRVGRLVRKPLPKPVPCPVDPLNLTFDRIGTNDCRFIVTDDAPFLFCGHPKDGESSYCAHHHFVTVRHD